MGIKYQVKGQLLNKDLLDLPKDLQAELQTTYFEVLAVDPHQCQGYSSHNLYGRLKGYRALEVDWGGKAYRLVYRIYRIASSSSCRDSQSG